MRGGMSLMILVFSYRKYFQTIAVYELRLKIAEVLVGTVFFITALVTLLMKEYC
jgi:hypothetical protein